MYSLPTSWQIESPLMLNRSQERWGVTYDFLLSPDMELVRLQLSIFIINVNKNMSGLRKSVRIWSCLDPASFLKTDF
jgi:hypothetical protein